jgi:hypothetical protein
MSAHASLGAFTWWGLLISSRGGAEVGAESCVVPVLEAAVAVDDGVPTLAASEVSGMEDAVVPAPKARKTSPCGSVGPPEPGSCEEPSANKVAAREVEALEDVGAVVPETACCFSCTDWQTANRYRCLKKDPPMAASLPTLCTGVPEEAAGRSGVPCTSPLSS